MPRIPTVKNHPDRKDIERDIVSGKSKTRIAKKYNITQEAITWHEKNNMITHQMISAVAKKEGDHGMDVLQNLNNLITRTEKILEKAENRNHNNQALAAIRELRASYGLISAIQLKLIELQQVSGEVSEEELNRREREESFRMEFEEGMEVFCWEERRLWDRLHLKAATRSTDRIEGIIYDDTLGVREEDTREEIIEISPLEISEEQEEEPPMRVRPVEPDVIFSGPMRRARGCQ